jgi:hypothetical protein
VGPSGLRGEWGPALDWPETGTPGPDLATDHSPLDYPDEVSVGQAARPAGFSLLHPGGPGAGNGPASVIPATTEETAGTDLLDESGLPRRVRQASLAPQLRESPARPGPSADLGILPEQQSDYPPPEPSASERTPEETRATMSAIQRGWERGRSVFDPAEGNGEPGPGSAASGATDATDTMDAVGTGTGSVADPAATRNDGGGADGEMHRSDD